MFSLRTKTKLINIAEGLTAAEIDRILVVFEINVPKENGQQISKAKKANAILEILKNSGTSPGPLGSTIERDFLQYLIDDFFIKEPIQANVGVDFFGQVVAPAPIAEDTFSEKYPELANLLKQDGFIVRHHEIRQLLPEELVAANIETELVRLLRKYGFGTTEGHLMQGIDSHSQGNWAAANAQFRTFIESLLIEISNRLVPAAAVANSKNAIIQLGNINPAFLSTHLNEVKTGANPGLNAPFVQGLMNRLHPHGSHPGLSDEEDSSFRYHMSSVFGRYLLAMLERRIG